MKITNAGIFFLVAQSAVQNVAFCQQVVLPNQSSGAALIATAKNADEAWVRVLDLSKAIAPPPSAATKSVRPPLGASELSRSEMLIQASLAAKAFTEKYSTDRRNAEARKLEPLLALQSIQTGSNRYKPKAFELGSSYRADKRNSPTDRFDVALMMETQILGDALKGKRLIDDGARYEQLADSLYAELGDIPETYGLYFSIIRTTDVATSTRVASKILGMKAAPEWAKESAQAAIDRSKLIGRPLPLTLKAVSGRELNLSQPNDRPTVICYWHSSGAQRDFAAVERFKRQITQDVRWLYVGIGGPAPRSDLPIKATPLTDSHCYEAAQGGKPAATLLKVQQTPFAFVLDAGGNLLGYGPPEMIASFLKGVGK